MTQKPFKRYNKLFMTEKSGIHSFGVDMMCNLAVALAI